MAKKVPNKKKVANSNNSRLEPLTVAKLRELSGVDLDEEEAFRLMNTIELLSRILLENNGKKLNQLFPIDDIHSQKNNEPW